jgi:hypothetical protein
MTGDLARSMVSAPYDALAQFGMSPSRTSDEARRTARTFGACVLLATGVAGAVWLIVLVHAAIFRPQTIGLLNRLTPANVEDITLTLPSGKVQLPPAGMTLIGYFVLVLLASIAGKIVAAMIKHGVSLLSRESARASEPPGEPPPPG